MDVRMLATADSGKALTAEEELGSLQACLENRSRSFYPASFA
jgi:hypothetical protein